MKVNLTNKYFLYRLRTREYELEKVVSVLKTSTEVYFDRHTGRNIKVGRHDNVLIRNEHEITFPFGDGDRFKICPQSA